MTVLHPYATEPLEGNFEREEEKKGETERGTF